MRARMGCWSHGSYDKPIQNEVIRSIGVAQLKYENAVKPALGEAEAADGAVSSQKHEKVATPRTMPGSITVIVPSYNCGQFIAEAIESILAQTLAPDEIIVVDDGSNDDTEQVVGRFVDPRLRYIRQTNAGVSVARNTGLAAASGEFVAFLDADDRWRPTLLEKLHNIVAHDPKLVCAFANFVRFHHDAGVLPRDQFQFYPELQKLLSQPGPTDGTHLLQEDAFCSLVRCGEIPAYTQVMMFRRRLIDGVRFNPRLRICQDMEWVLQTFMRGRVAFTPEVLAEVRRHDTNATRDYSVMALHKLNALRALEPHVTTPAHRAAYKDRLVKAHVDAAFATCQMGEVRKAWRTFADGLLINSSPLRKLKGFARILIATFLVTTRASQRTAAA
jgi:glycosyltransferase involved in cell wall biosynthesis